MRAMLPQRPRAVITGAASGLGRALSLRLAARSAHLVLSDVDEAGLEETRARVEAAGGRVKATRCDVASADDVGRLHETSRAELGDVDLLINNAGVAVGGKVGDIPLADWSWIMGINLWGVIYGCHHFLPQMKAQRSGHILNVASIAAFASGAEMAPYNVTKAGVVSLSETLAAELEGTGVGVTVLCPYFFTTNIANSSRSHSTLGTDAINKLMSKTPVQAHEVAELALSACDKGALYAFPHREAKVISAIKRAAPETLLRRLAPYITKKMREGAG